MSYYIVELKKRNNKYIKHVRFIYCRDSKALKATESCHSTYYTPFNADKYIAQRQTPQVD